MALNDLSSRVLDVQCSVDRLGLGTCGDVGECAEDCVKELEAIRAESRGTESGYPQCPDKLVQRYNELQYHR